MGGIEAWINNADELRCGIIIMRRQNVFNQSNGQCLLSIKESLIPRNILFALVLYFLAIAFLAVSSACQTSQNEADLVLVGVQQNIQKEMGLLDQDLAAAAKNLSGLDLTGTHARIILTGLLQNRPYMVDSCLSTGTQR